MFEEKETFQMRRMRKRHERVGKLWRRLRPKVDCCPDCFETNVLLNDSFVASRIKRYSIECNNCHWVSKSFPTIRMAVHSWNMQMPTDAVMYNAIMREDALTSEK